MLEQPLEVVIDPIQVLSVKAEGGTKGAQQAFDYLESKLATLRGRRFYGTYNVFTEEYRACMVKMEGEDGAKVGLESWTIPGGKYVTRRVEDWNAKVGQFPQLFNELADGQSVDKTRPSLEFYRSRREAVLYLPVK